MSDEYKSYEDMSDIIDVELKKRKRTWHLYAIAWMDYDDVCQLIRKHIHSKWHMWDQTKALEPWISTIIRNRIKNIIRDNYQSFARPCLNCPFNQGGEHKIGNTYVELCGYTKSGTQSCECPTYKKWSKTKKRAYDVKLPVPVENHTQEVHNKGSDIEITEEIVTRLHTNVMAELTPRQKQGYQLLIIDGLPEEEVAKKMGFVSNEGQRKAGYRQIKNLLKIFKEKAKKVLETQDIIIYPQNKYGKN